MRVILIVMMLAAPAFAQTAPKAQHVFPIIVDGVFTGGYYRTEVAVSHTGGPSVSCTLATSIAVSMERMDGSTSSSTSFPFSVSSGQVVVLVTRPLASLRSGFATLSCSRAVDANASYAMYAAGISAPIGEANVPSVNSANTLQFGVDHRGSNRLGIAIANPYTSSMSVSFILDGFGLKSVGIAAGSVFVGFLDEMFPVVPGYTGRLLFNAPSGHGVYAIGLKYRGNTFTTVQPTALIP